MENDKQNKDNDNLKEEDQLYSRSDFLSKADSIINGERQDRYGTPENSFPILADLWNAFLTAIAVNKQYPVLSSQDASIMMALMKIARISNGTQQRDSFIDAIGYLAIAGELAEREGIDAMTDYERAKHLALKQIKERWAEPLEPKQKQGLYKYLIQELKELIWEESDDQSVE